jgi:flagellar hook-associated protein 1 FlgK
VSFFGINLASRALQSHQRSLEVTGQNIANVDTPGYSRQIAVTRSANGIGALALDRSGTPIAPEGGVDVALVLRTHAAWLDRTAGALTAQSGDAATRERVAHQVESLLAEPTSAGLQSTLDRFFSAFGNLATRPDDLAARDGVLRAGTEVADHFRRLSLGLDSLGQDLRDQARDSVSAINQIAGQVAALNRVIGLAQAAGAQPNELLDERDRLLSDLTRRAGVTISGQEGSAVVVSLGGVTLIQGEHATALDLAPGSTLEITVRGSGETVTIPAGELRALQEGSNTLLPGYRTRLDAVREDLAAAVNTLHQSGSDLNGAAGLPFFVAVAGGHLTVNATLLSDGRRVVAGDGTAGDGRVALAISDLGRAAGPPLPAYRALVAEVGAAAQEGRRLSEQTSASLQQVRVMQAAESGVNLDEELAQMAALQHAYSASARLLATYDEMLVTLIERTG